MTDTLFSGNKALVTGGTRSFGRGFAEGLRDQGASVTITGTKPGGNTVEGVEYRAIDFTDEEATSDFAEWAAQQNFDVLINNAGINIFADTTELDPEVFRRVQLVNLHAPMKLCRAVAPGMKAKGWGRIVNISSILGKVGRQGNASYTASKFGLDGMTVSMAIDLAPYGVVMNCVAPGFFLTDMTMKLHDEADRARLAESIPMKRLGNIPELVKFVLWLAGPENTYIVGQNIAIDGGFTRM